MSTFEIFLAQNLLKQSAPRRAPTTHAMRPHHAQGRQLRPAIDASISSSLSCLQPASPSRPPYRGELPADPSLHLVSYSRRVVQHKDFPLGGIAKRVLFYIISNEISGRGQKREVHCQDHRAGHKTIGQALYPEKSKLTCTPGPKSASTRSD